jgi:pyruvate dehydrogenase E2 component (dihydrolipoamide acetyltransferase)
MDMEAGTVAAWHVVEGESVEKGDALFDIETDKATMEIESPQSGTLQFVAAREGDKVASGGNVAWIFSADVALVAPKRSCGERDGLQAETPEPAISSADLANRQTADTGVNGKYRASPLARRLAKSNNMDLATVTGSGPRGRIIRADIEMALANDAADAAKPPVAAQPPARADVRKIADALGIGYTEIKVDRMRAIIADRLTESKITVPHFYLEQDCKIDALLALRAQLNTVVTGAGTRKISVNDLLVRACALALRAVPEANASWAGDHIIRYNSANVSVAVAVEGGLITPVVRDAQDKDVQTISAEIAGLAERARTGKLTKRDYLGGSFSISNLGMFGIKSFAAIINPPESMILAVGHGCPQIVVGENGLPETATVMSVTLSCDHRVVDGAVGAKWLNNFRKFIENPAALLLR